MLVNPFIPSSVIFIFQVKSSDVRLIKDFIPSSVILLTDEIQELANKEHKIKDYHGEKKYAYDYYFTIQNDNDYLYFLQTNIDMNNGFSDKWHWYCSYYSSKFYKILKTKIPGLIASTYKENIKLIILNGATELIIPKKINNLTIIDKIAFILSYKPGEPFKSGK